MCRMDGVRMVKRVFESEVEGTRGRGRPKGRWVDGVKDVMRERGFSLEQGTRVAGDRVE